MGFIPEWALGVGFIIVAVSIARAVTGRFLGSPASLRRRLDANTTDPEVVELRQTVDALQARLTEVEERLDFAERLLTKPSR